MRLLILMRADPGASLRMAATAERGAAGQVEAIEAVGGAVEAQWPLLGRYDLALVATFPSEDVAAAYCLMAASAGYSTETHLALSPDQLNLAAEMIAAEVREPTDEDKPAGDAPIPQDD